MGFASIRTLISVFIEINPKIDIKNLVFESIAFFCLFNSLLWAFSIPKIIYDEIYKNIILS